MKFFICPNVQHILYKGLSPNNNAVQIYLDSVNNRYFILIPLKAEWSPNKCRKITIDRYDISNEVWALLEPLLPGRKVTWGGNARDNRKFIKAVFWILRMERHGMICHLNMVAETTSIDVSAGGETKGLGKEYLRLL